MAGVLSRVRGLAVPVGELARCGGGGAGTGAPGTSAGSAAWARPGSPPRSAVSCRAGARAGRACGIVRAVFGALADPVGVTAHRPGAFERVQLAMSDWQDTRERLADVEARMVAVLDDLQLTSLVTTIAGLTAAGVAAILARPATRPGSPPRGPWSSMPGCARATTPPAPSRARLRSRAAGGPGCGWLPGARSGPRCRTTRSWPPGSLT